MQISTLVLLLLLISVFAFYTSQNRSISIASKLGGIRSLPSLPSYYGAYSVLFTLIPVSIFLTLWISLDQIVIERLVVDKIPQEFVPSKSSDYELMINRITSISEGIIYADSVLAWQLDAASHMQKFEAISRWSITVISILMAVLSLYWATQKVSVNFNARPVVENVMERILLASACVAIFTTIGIIFSVLFESIQFFRKVPFFDFVFGLEWSPQTAIREDQVGSSGSFGAVPLFVGTILISLVAMIIAVPIGLMSAIYLSEYASLNVRTIAKPALEILAGIPTVVYGFFAAITVAPVLRDFGESVGLDIASESALAAGAVMGIMIIPFISSIADDVISAVPQSMRDGSLAMGATHSETVKRVVIPAALPGIVGGILLAMSRAIGETMIVVMAAGLAANLTVNPLDAVTTVTVQIVTLLTGDQEFDSAKTLAAFALGLMLFVVTLMLNIFALQIVKKYREQYE